MLTFTRLNVVYLVAHHAAARASKAKLSFQLSFFFFIMSFIAFTVWKFPNMKGKHVSKVVGVGCWGLAFGLLDPNDFQGRAALFFFLCSLFCLTCNIFIPSPGSRVQGIKDFCLAAMGIEDIGVEDEQNQDAVQDVLNGGEDEQNGQNQEVEMAAIA